MNRLIYGHWVNELITIPFRPGTFFFINQSSNQADRSVKLATAVISSRHKPAVAIVLTTRVTVNGFWWLNLLFNGKRMTTIARDESPRGHQHITLELHKVSFYVFSGDPCVPKIILSCFKTRRFNCIFQITHYLLLITPGKETIRKLNLVK